MPTALSARPAALLTAALCAVFALLAGAAAARADDGVELLVRRDPGIVAADRADIRADAGVSFERRLRLADAEVVTVPSADAAGALAALRADPDVRWAQRNGDVHATAATTDPLFIRQYALRNTGQSVGGFTGTAGADMHVVDAWPQSTGAGVTVAVVDSGADLAQPDLAGRLWHNPGETGNGRETNGIDDDGNGLVDDWQGWDFVGRDNTPQDGDGHGTHVAGIIAAANGNGVGLSGVAPDSQVLPLRALDDTGTGTWADVADAFALAGEMGIPIVNASLGAAGSVQAITDVIAAHPATLYVVAAGNDGLDIESPATTYFPCEAPAPNVVCVGASDQDDRRASFSNYGATAVDVFAPGVRIVSTVPGGYAYMSGTSMASPDLAGVAALVKAAAPSLGAAGLKAALLAGADARTTLAGLAAHGRANAAASLMALGLDTDGDGVLDAADGCPTVAGPVARQGCPVVDSDGDGVEDPADRCPAIPAATADGCPVITAPAAAVPDSRSGSAGGPAPQPGQAEGIAPTPEPLAGTLPAAATAVVSASTRVVRRCLRAQPCRNRVTMAVATRAATSVSVKLAVRRCTRRGCRWTDLVTVTTPGSMTPVRVTLGRLLTAGRYRVRVVAHGARGDSTPVLRTLALRR